MTNEAGVLSVQRRLGTEAVSGREEGVTGRFDMSLAAAGQGPTAQNYACCEVRNLECRPTLTPVPISSLLPLQRAISQRGRGVHRLQFCCGTGRRRATPELAFMPASMRSHNGLSALCWSWATWLYAGGRSLCTRVHGLSLHLSAVFLVGYLAYHFVPGHTPFTGTGPLRAV